MASFTDPAGNSIIKVAATITAGNLSVDVAHTLGAVPGLVVVEVQDVYGINSYVTAKTASQVTLNIPNPQPVDANFVVGVS